MRKRKRNRNRNMGCFFSGYWFKSIISLRKAKKDRSKKVKVHSAATEKSKENSPPHEESCSVEDLQTSHGMSSEYTAAAATRIQKAFRAYKGRKAVRCGVKKKGGVERFNVLIHGHESEKQASSALSHIHSWSNIQAQIRARRHHMVTQGRIKQKKLENQSKLEAKLHEIEVEWSGSSDTMEEILSRIQQREEAAVKRERAMAYAFSHQWRANPTQYLGQTYYSLGKENWGWSWKERWIAARPWEIRVLHVDQLIDPKKEKEKANGSTIRQLGSKTDLKTPLPNPAAAAATKSANLSTCNGKGTAAKAKNTPTLDNQASDLQPVAHLD